MGTGPRHVDRHGRDDRGLEGFRRDAAQSGHYEVSTSTSDRRLRTPVVARRSHPFNRLPVNDLNVAVDVPRTDLGLLLRAAQRTDDRRLSGPNDSGRRLGSTLGHASFGDHQGTATSNALRRPAANVPTRTRRRHRRSEGSTEWGRPRIAARRCCETVLYAMSTATAMGKDSACRTTSTHRMIEPGTPRARLRRALVGRTTSRQRPLAHAGIPAAAIFATDCVHRRRHAIADYMRRRRRLDGPPPLGRRTGSVHGCLCSSSRRDAR